VAVLVLVPVLLLHQLQQVVLLRLLLLYQLHCQLLSCRSCAAEKRSD
jgi:hypothetical protein